MKRERFNQIQKGEQIIWRARPSKFLTRGKRYEVRGRGSISGALHVLNDRNEIILATAIDFAAGYWHLVSDEWYAGTKAGDKLMFRGYVEDDNDGCPSYLTLNKVYTAYGEGERLHVLDDNGEPEHIGVIAMAEGVWLNVGQVTPDAPRKEYNELVAGDVLTYTPKQGGRSFLTKDKDYAVAMVDDGDVLIQDDDGDLALVRETAYMIGAWTLKSIIKGPDLVCRHVLPEDYWSLIDFALETGDKEWYDELMQKAKMPV